MGTVDQAAKRYFTKDQARTIATKLGIDLKALVLSCASQRNDG